MVLFDGIYEWKGWGGLLKLASGKCRMWIFDLNRMEDGHVLHLRPFLVVVSDLPKEGMSKGEVTIRSACGHIATRIAEEYGVEPSRMLFVEYFPEKVYGVDPPKRIPAVLDAVEFAWKDRVALEPRRHPLERSMRRRVMAMIEG
ncbi:MAG: hypothetical protein PVH30_07975 [Desulfobacterales bacterium]|jgi:hypothetical protein